MNSILIPEDLYIHKVTEKKIRTPKYCHGLQFNKIKNSNLLYKYISNVIQITFNEYISQFFLYKVLIITTTMLSFEPIPLTRRRLLHS